MKKTSKVSKQRSLARKRRIANSMQRRDVRMYCMMIVLTTVTSHTRIPHGQQDFDNYFHSVAAYLAATRPSEAQARGLMLGLTPINLSDLAARFTQWYTGAPLTPGLWERHTGPNNNSTVNQDVVDFIKNFRTFFNPLLDIMAASPALDNEDRHILHIAHPDGTVTERGRITRVLIVGLTSLPGGHVKVTTRWADDSTRPSIDPLADGVEFKYIIVPPGEPAPASVNACNLYKYSPTAVFHLDHVPDLAGHRLYGYARSVNLGKPENNGDWCTVQSVIIQA